MLRSLRWGGTDPQYYGASGGMYIHTQAGGGPPQDFQMPDESPLVFWEGRQDFVRHALDVDLHPSIGAPRLLRCESAVTSWSPREPLMADDRSPPYARALRDCARAAQTITRPFHVPSRSRAHALACV